jgi:hypothetical protein
MFTLVSILGSVIREVAHGQLYCELSCGVLALQTDGN